MRSLRPPTRRPLAIRRRGPGAKSHVRRRGSLLRGKARGLAGLSAARSPQSTLHRFTVPPFHRFTVSAIGRLARPRLTTPP
ncbi:hypothetical protein VARIO8X_20262 [Burkholderiales bacterium 8X]|nr:hypothetical protein VARIO8X_20262 [Burkholderiales bacterium 8X]